MPIKNQVLVLGMIVTAVITAAVFYSILVKPREEVLTPNGSVPTSTVVNGPRTETSTTVLIQSIDVGSRTIIANLKEETPPVTMSVLPGATVFDEHGVATALSYIRQGFTVALQGEVGSDVTLRNVSRIEVLKVPRIIVYAPVSFDEVSSPLTLRGEARVDESNLSYRLIDGDVGVLAEGIMAVQSSTNEPFGSFDFRIAYPNPRTSGGLLEIFQASSRESEANHVTIPVRFRIPGTISVKVFFGNTRLNPNSTDCTQVYSVFRSVPVTTAIARAALEELLKGINDTERLSNYTTSIPNNVRVQALTIGDGTARADFSSNLETGTSGSCRVTAVRAQIIETLKQFPTIRNVIISIDGRTEDILEP